MDNEIEETEEYTPTVKDYIVLSAMGIAAVYGTGVIAKLGWDLASKGVRVLKEKKAKKDQSK